MLNNTQNITKKVNQILNKKSLYKDYDYTQVLIRYFFSIRRIKKRSNDITFYDKRIYLLKIKKLLLNFYKFFGTPKKKKVDFLIVTNTEYKIHKALDYLKKYKNKKIIIFADYKKKVNFSNKQKKFLINKSYFSYIASRNIKKTKYYNFIFKTKLFENVIKFYNPTKIIIVEGDSVSDAIIGQISKKNMIECLCLQHGFNPSFLMGNNNKFLFKNYFSDFTYVADSIKTANFLRQKKIAYKINIHPSFKSNKKISNKTKILFCIPTLLEKEYLDISVMLKIVKIINHFLNRFPDKKMIIRFHPDGLANKLIISKIIKTKNIEYHYPNQISIHDSFKEVCIAIFIYGSSLIVDAIKEISFPVILKIKDTYDFSNIKKNNLGAIFSTEAEFKKKLTLLLNDRKKLEKNLQQIKNYLLKYKF